MSATSTSLYFILYIYSIIYTCLYYIKSFFFVRSNYICDSISTSTTNNVEIIQTQLNNDMATSVYTPPTARNSVGRYLISRQMNVIIGIQQETLPKQQENTTTTTRKHYQNNKKTLPKLQENTTTTTRKHYQNNKKTLPKLQENTTTTTRKHYQNNK